MNQDELCKLHLRRIDVGQILNALEIRAETWENTVRYARGEFVEGTIEEYSSPEETEEIMHHYQFIIGRIEAQLATPE